MRTSLQGLLTLPLALVLAACSNPVEHEDHPQGLVIVDANGAVVATDIVGAQATGEISVGLDAPSTFTVLAVSDDGDEITIDGGELEIALSDAPQGWTFELEGANRVVIAASEAGTTTLRVLLLHNGHEELTGEFEVRAE